MPDQKIVEEFLTCYQKHDFNGMHSCLDSNVTFSDFAFDKIRGREVRAMWHWFCVSYPPRKNPVNVPEFEIIKTQNSTVVARYRVTYPYGDKQRPVNYFIEAKFKIQDNRIIEQTDMFSSISQFEFAKMALGFPFQLLSLTPLLQNIVRRKATEKLKKFMNDHVY